MRNLGILGVACALLGLTACGRAVVDSDARAGAGGAPADTGGDGGVLAGSAGDNDAGAGGADPKGELVLKRQIDWIWVDDARLYWLAEPDQFETCEKRDCAHTIASYGRAIQFPVFGEGHVFWFQSGETLSCPVTGCGEAVNVIQATQWDLLAVHDGYLYRNASSIDRCTLPSCTGAIETFTTEGTALSSPGLLFQGPSAFWRNQSGIRSRRLDLSGAVITISNDTAVSTSLAVNQDGVYWIDANDHVVGCPLAGCGTGSPTEYVQVEGKKGALTADAQHLYWKSAGRVYSAPLTKNAEPVPLTPTGVATFAIDDRFVYWTEGDFSELGQNIRRVPKLVPPAQ